MKNYFNLTFFILLLPFCIKIPAQDIINVKPIPVENFKADLVVSWNKRIIKIAIAEDGLLTLKGVRTLSMLHIAMHDAINSIYRINNNYILDSNIKEANPIAAAAQAAYLVAVSQYPHEEKQFKDELFKWFKNIEGTKTKSIELGTKSAQAILTARENDNWNAEAEYAWHPMGPGVYAEFNEHSGTPEGFVFGSGWAKAKPFMLEQQDQFRAPPPPLISSENYTRDFNEVKEVGRHNSTKRTRDQSHLAMWWKDFAENSHNRLARELAIIEKLDLLTASRLFALLNMSICDAYICVFENKFYYNHWRPFTAIRWAANDGNPNTIPDPDWNNLHKHTYAFPSYPSAHGCASAAAMTILEDTFGKDYSFTMTTEEVDASGPMSGKIKMNPATRSFKNFVSAAMECSLSRIYLGIHFRYDSIEGFNLGRQIGKYALKTFLTRSTESDETEINKTMHHK